MTFGNAPVRTLLRLYGIDLAQPLTVRVRALARWDEPLPPVREVRLELAPGGAYGDLVPAYAELDLQRAFSGLTRNDTNDVTIVTAK